MSRIYEIFGTNAHAMTRALMESAGAACKIPSGASVALKPNLVVAASPETGATTHAGVLSGAIEYLRDHGFRDISIIEGSWVGDDTGRAFRAAGYEAVGKKYGVPLFDLKRDKTRRVDTPLRPMDICCRALDADYLINLPVLKGHCQTAMTCALKNCKGCLPDREKRRFHAEGLMRPIAALAAALRPELTIVDSLCGDLDFEEGGNPVPTGRMLLGEDPVQLDAYGCRLMGLALEQAPYIQMAEAWGGRLHPAGGGRCGAPQRALRGGGLPRPLRRRGRPHPHRPGQKRLLGLLRKPGARPPHQRRTRPTHSHRPGLAGDSLRRPWNRRLLQLRQRARPGLPAPGRGHPARPLRPLLSPTGNAHLISLRSQVRFCVQAANPLQIRYLHRLLSPVQ